MTTPVDEYSTPRSLRSAALRALILLLVLAIAFLIMRWTAVGDLLTREHLSALLLELRQTAWAGPALVGLYAILSPLGMPISPLIFAGGAVFGFFSGLAFNLVGSLLGAAASFLLAQQLGRDLVLHLVSRQRLDQVEHLLERHGFWALVRIRFLPIFPFALINYGAALAGVRFSVFLLSSALSLLPSIAVWTYLSYALVSAAAEERAGLVFAAIAALLALFALSFLPALVRVIAARSRT
jgi:uncharacterized membrane protein YdjX (TVP38/TMEM64 family)